MSFRQFGGLQFASKHNAVASYYNTTGNLLVTQNVGQPNSYINLLSDISGNITLYGNLDVSGNINVSGDVDISGNLYVHEDVDISGNLYVDGDVDISGNLHVQKNIDCSGNGTFTNSIRLYDGPYYSVISENSTNLNLVNYNTGGYINIKPLLQDGITVNNLGKVGIKNTNPQGTLDVTGNLITTMDASINSITVGRGGGNISTNTTLGFEALLNNTDGSYNTAIGYNAGQNLSGNSSYNTFLGFGANVPNSSLYTNSTALGYNATIGTSNQIVLGGQSVSGSYPGVKIPGSYVGIGGVYTPGNGYALDVSGNTNSYYIDLSSQGNYTGNPWGVVPKKYIDDRVQGLIPLAACQCATTASVNLLAAPPTTIDGYTVQTGNRVLVNYQSGTNPSLTNGIYVVNLTTSPYWTYAADWTGDTYRCTVNVLFGSLNGNTQFIQIQNPGIVSVNQILFQVFGSSDQAGRGLSTEFLGNTLYLDVDTSLNFVNFLDNSAGPDNINELNLGTNTNNIYIGKVSAGNNKIRVTTDSVGINNNSPSSSYALDVSGNVNISGNLQVQKDIYCSGAINIIGDVDISENLHVQKNIDCSGNVNIRGDVDISGNLHVQKNIDCSGNLYLQGDVDISGNLHVQGNIDCSGNGSFDNSIYLYDLSSNVLYNSVISQIGSALNIKNNNGGGFIYINPAGASIGITVFQNGYVGIGIATSSIYALNVNGSVNATSYNSSSDYRIKENVTQLDSTFVVDNLNPVTYLNKKSDKQDIGLIAHELQEIFPELVNGEKDGEEFQSVNYLGLIPILIKEIQELKKEIKLVKIELNELKNK